MDDEPTNKPKTQIRFEALVKEFVDNGFTEQQATYLIKLLDSYIPLV